VPSQTPVTLFTGFLGSGKTTIIANVVDDLQKTGEKIVYLKNEVGDVSVDTKMLQQHHIPTSELLSGCICCTLVGSFAVALKEIIEKYLPDRVIVEASGAADPSAIALTVSSVKEVYRDAVIGVIDVVNFTGYKDLSLTARHQAEFTDIIVFNKVEQVDEQQKHAVVGYVRELNQKAPIVEAPEGRVDARLVVGVISDSGQDAQPEKNHQHDHEHHAHLDELDTLTLDVPAKMGQQEFRAWLTTLPKTVFRAKGVISTADGAVLVNKVGQRVEVTPETELPPSSKLVLIGFSIGELKEQLQSQLTAA
jgi:G3E family GTPase